ncbi:MAG: SDR family NAD(P)-dependent oxidoreductase [Nitrospirales bacterium]|nr:SDR family NAD(P)-dependent oxidoreductase [Nitrospirales bacterium]
MKEPSRKIVVMTGASGGIGKALALRFSEEGVSLHLIGRNRGSLELLGVPPSPPSSSMHYYQSDLTKDKDLIALEETLKTNLDHIDVLIHCAGALILGRMENSLVNDLDEQYRINVRAPYALTKALLPLMKSSKGQIVFINSSIWQQARAGISQYASTKYALKAIADSVRDEVNADGIRVLSVYLGRTATPMQEVVHNKEGLSYHPEYLIQPDDVATIVFNILTLPRTSEVTDIHIRPMKKAPVGR